MVFYRTYVRLNARFSFSIETCFDVLHNTTVAVQIFGQMEGRKEV